MILNLSKKTIISSNPLYRRVRAFGIKILSGRCFLKNDSVIFQNCRAICRFCLADEADVLFVNKDNSIGKIDASCRKTFLISGERGAIVLLPKGNAFLTGTEVGDVLDLNAELTPSQKKNFLKMPEIVVPIAGPVIMSQEKR